MGKPRTLTVALVGNPNTGKSTLFNALTGLRQHVGNYPGVTVEMKTGTARAGDADAEFQLIEVRGRGYYRTLREKLGWGGRLKLKE